MNYFAIMVFEENLYIYTDYMGPLGFSKEMQFWDLMCPSVCIQKDTI